MSRPARRWREPLKLDEVVARTDVGRVREHNEDQHFAAEEIGLLAVADGMGGLAMGEVASATAVATLGAATEVLEPLVSTADKAPTSANRIQLAQALEVLSHIASQRIQQATQGQPSGTTLVSAIAAGGHLILCHVGDSRAYLLRGGSLRSLTQDHTIAAARLRQGLITEEEHDQSPYQHMLYQALGTQGEIDPDLLDVALAAGDVLLLCTDGLTGPVSELAIADVVRESEDLEAAADRLIQLANDNGGPDNITLILARVGPAQETAEEVDASAAMLRGCAGFEHLSEYDHSMMGLYLETAEVEPEAPLAIHRGVHLLLGGEASGPEGESGPGDMIGVAGFATGTPSKTETHAVGAVRAVVLTQAAFEILDKRRPALTARLLRGLLAVLAARFGVELDD